MSLDLQLVGFARFTAPSPRLSAGQPKLKLSSQQPSAYVMLAIDIKSEENTVASDCVKNGVLSSTQALA